MTVSHVENRAWVLRIKDVKESDKGWYMCQINTDPMKNQVGYLNVVGKQKIPSQKISCDNSKMFYLSSAARHSRLSHKHRHGS